MTLIYQRQLERRVSKLLKENARVYEENSRLRDELRSAEAAVVQVRRERDRALLPTIPKWPF